MKARASWKGGNGRRMGPWVGFVRRLSHLYQPSGASVLSLLGKQNDIDAADAFCQGVNVATSTAFHPRLRPR
jgi:hypothetical protein